jgi:hypothetical protein
VKLNPVSPSICAEINTKRALSAAHAYPLSARAAENQYLYPALRSVAPIVGANSFFACYIVLGRHVIRNNDDHGILITTLDGLNTDAAETIQQKGLAGISRHSLRFFSTGE